jgi:hypothetical protein
LRVNRQAKALFLLEFSFLLKIFSNHPKVWANQVVTDPTRKFENILNFFKKNPKVPEKFDVTGTRCKKVGVEKLI